MTNLERKVEKLIESSVESLGYELYDVVYQKEGKDYFLRVFIDQENGISLEDCEKTSNAISDLLDEADYIKEQYYLEVSSAGIERTLRQDKHFEANIGNEVEVKLFKPIQKEKTLIGYLKTFDSNDITIENDTGEVKISRKDIANIKTRYQW